MLVRGGYRLIPWWCRRAVYRPIVARYTERLQQDLATLAPSAPSEREYPDECEYPEMSASDAASWPEPPWSVSQRPASQPPVGQ